MKSILLKASTMILISKENISCDLDISDKAAYIEYQIVYSYLHDLKLKHLILISFFRFFYSLVYQKILVDFLIFNTIFYIYIHTLYYYDYYYHYDSSTLALS